MVTEREDCRPEGFRFGAGTRIAIGDPRNQEQAAKIQEPSDLWELEQYLTQRRQEIDRTFDYSYSVLPLVFANLLRTGRLDKDELRGLSEDKLARIYRGSVHI